MKKRLLALLPLLVLLVIAAPASADQLVLPSVLKEIGPEAFMNDTSLDEVILPDGLETIGDYAFAGSSVTRIYLPESITNIGLHAFDGAANVVGYGPDNTYASDFFDNLSLPFIHQSLTRAVGDFLFSYEDEVWWIEYQGTDANIIVPMPDFVGDTPIGFASNAFRGNKSIQSIKIPEGILWIGSYAFEGCESLKTIHLPESMRLINDGAFSGCTSLEEINLPDGVEIIGNKAFLNCSSLTSIIIPDSVPSIGYQAFQNCSSLTSITLSDGVKVIASSAFSNCSSLTSITIPDGVKAIGSSAFSNCSSLTSIIIPNGVTSIGSSTFSSCNGLTSISIPESVTSIGSSAFWRCSNLLSITIPDSVTSIGSSAFYNCPARRYATIGSDASIALSKAGYTFTPAGEEKYELKYEYNNNSLVGLEIITADEDIVALEIPDGVTSITDYAFHGCSSLASITIPDGMTSIGSGAFYDCSSLTSITIPDGVTSINDYAFYDCSSLTSISIPDSVTSIGDWAFFDCKSLTSITIPDSVTSISNSAFSSSLARMYATLGSDASIALSKAGYSFTPIGEEKYALIYLYTNNELSGLRILDVDKDIVAFEIPDGVTNIGNYAFCECSSLTSITIPDGMTSIGDGAFYDCSSLTSITIPSNVISIGEFAFQNCDDLTIYGEAGSYAEQYANDNNIPFVAVDLVHTVRVSGSLACANMNLPYGQTVQVSGTAYSVNAPLSRVTLTIEGYNIENDENDRYATVDLSGQNLSTISLADYPALSLDASREPLNTPGTYVIKLWAKAKGMTKGMLLDSMSVTVAAPDSVTLSGTVATASGSPIPGAIVMVADSKDTEKIIATVITGKDGRWSVSGLDTDKDYIVTYSHNDYAFDTTSTNPVGSVVTGTLNGEDNGIDISFTMTQNGQEVSTIVVGTTVDFVISAPGASYVRLVVDGTPYEEIKVGMHGYCSFSHVFSKGGARVISFQSMKTDDYLYSAVCDPKPLNVTAIDGSFDIETLSIPEIDDINDLLVGNDFAISWKNAVNADGYHVYLYTNKTLLWDDITTETAITVPGVDIEGYYTIVVVAYGYGYNQSECGKDITIYALDSDDEKTINVVYGAVTYYDVDDSTTVETKLSIYNTEYGFIMQNGAFIGEAGDRVNIGNEVRSIDWEVDYPFNGTWEVCKFDSTWLNVEKISEKWLRITVLGTITGNKMRKSMIELSIGNNVKVSFTVYQLGDNYNLPKPLFRYPDTIANGNIERIYIDSYILNPMVTWERIPDLENEVMVWTFNTREDMEQLDYTKANRIPAPYNPAATYPYQDLSSISVIIFSEQFIRENQGKWICVQIRHTDGIAYSEYSSAYFQITTLTQKQNTFRECFSTNSSVENPTLVVQSARLSNLVYKARNGDLAYKNNNVYIAKVEVAQALTELGFYPDTIIGYGFDSYKHSIGVVFALQEINDTPLISIVLRGTSTPEEWISNATVGNGSTHEGFDKAAQFVMERFEDYYLPAMSNKGYNVSQMKLWITGHSRGAAVGNLLASKYLSTGSNNIYAYLFATPFITHSPKTMSNIFNYVYEGDLVPNVPASAWSFQRSGVPRTIKDSDFAGGFPTLEGNQMKKLIRLLVTLLPTQQLYVDKIQSTIESFTSPDFEDLGSFMLAFTKTVILKFIENQWPIAGEIVSTVEALKVYENVISLASAWSYFEIDFPMAALPDYLINGHDSLNYYYWTLTNYKTPYIMGL